MCVPTCAGCACVRTRVSIMCVRTCKGCANHVHANVQRMCVCTRVSIFCTPTWAGCACAQECHSCACQCAKDVSIIGTPTWAGCACAQECQSFARAQRCSLMYADQCHLGLAFFSLIILHQACSYARGLHVALLTRLPDRNQTHTHAHTHTHTHTYTHTHTHALLCLHSLFALGQSVSLPP